MIRDNSDYYQWGKIKSKLSHMYPTLSKADLIWRHSNINDLLEIIALKLGKTTQELKAEVEIN